MRRGAFVLFILVGLVVTVFGAAKGLGYEPANPKADAPPPQASTAELVQASVRGCMEGLGQAEVGISDGVALVRCKVNLGMGR